jgi:diguanylate cyclase (GGDEF)-like protein
MISLTLAATKSEPSELEALLEQARRLPSASPEVVGLCELLRECAATHQERAVFVESRLLLAKHFNATLHYQEVKGQLESVLPDFALLAAPLQAEAYLLLAETYNLLGENETALTQAVRALELSRQERNPEREAMCLNTLAYIHDDLGLFQEALEYALVGLEILTRLSLAGSFTALVYNNIGNIYNHLGVNTQALEFYHKALAQPLASTDAQTGTILNNIGLIHADAEVYTTAIGFYKKAIVASERVKDGYMLIIEYSNCGRALSMLGDYQQASEAFGKALAWLKAHPSLDFEAMIHINLGESYAKQKLNDLAETHLLEGLKASLGSKSLRRTLRAHEHLCKVYEAKGELTKALEHHKQFHKLKVDALEQAASVRTKAMMTKFKVERLEQEQELYRLKNVELAAAVRQLEQLSHQDGLTGLYNRRFFDARLKSGLETTTRTQQPLCVALADIDNFKCVNDTFSHAIGDEVLKIVASIFMNTLRGADIVARYGGEEIVAMFPETTLANARMVCEKIREKVERYPWHHLCEGLAITVSIGLASYSETSSEKLVALADERLYRAKRTGKNKVEGKSE